MRNKALALLAGAALIAASGMAQDKVKFQVSKKHTGTSEYTATAPAAHKQVYAWMTRDRANTPLGIVSLYLDQPSEIKSMYPLSNLAWAGAWAGDKYVFDRYRTYKDTDGQTTWDHIALSTVDLKTGAVNDIVNWSDQYYFVINDMTYDYSTGTLYAIARDWYIDDFLSGFNFEYSAIFTINTNTGVIKTVKQFIDWESGMPSMTSPTYYTLACDLEGNFYSVNKSGELVKFDRDNDWKETVIGSTGLQPGQSTQSMEFDHSTGILYWAADFTTDPAALATVDIASGHASVIGNTGSDSHLVGLYIPFEEPQPGTPGAVSGYTLTPDANGGNWANLSWTNPTTTYGGANLASISKIEVLQDEQVIHTLNGTPGQSMDQKVEVSQPGYYTYTVTAANVLGRGLATGATKWIGHDVPDAVGKLGIGRNEDGSAMLSWEAPTAGLHGGWIDLGSLAYKITRYPDGVVVAPAVKETTFTDQTIPAMGRYSYVVEPYTADGVGEPAQSVEIALGSGISTFPWNTVFADVSEFNLWTVVNNNGGSTWEWKKRGLKDFDAFAMYVYDHDNDGDDYLISPDLYLKKGATYRVSFNYRGANAYHTENMEFTFGQGKTAEAQSTVLGSYTMTDGDGRETSVDLPVIEQTGVYNFAFHATSLKGNYNIYVTNVTIQQLTPGDDDEEKPELKAPYNVTVSVDHEHSSIDVAWNQEIEEPKTENITDDFESYPNWTINPTGKYDWSYIDGDKGIPYVDDWYEMPYPTDGQPLAAMIMAPYELYSEIYEANPPHSGKKYMLFKSNFYDENRQRPAPAPNDYLISPRLNFGQDFEFSFYCKADPDADGVEPLWNTEEFRVGYSTTGTEQEDFIWMTDAPEKVVTRMDEWTKKAYAIPAEAKYVCINYCTSNYSGYWFMVDDVFIGIPGTATASAMRKAAEATFKYYEIAIDNVPVATTKDTSCTVGNIANGSHAATVTAVYEEGRATSDAAQFVMNNSGVDTIDADLTDGPVSVYSLSGMHLGSSLDGLAPDTYIVVKNGRAHKVNVR